MRSVKLVWLLAVLAIGCSDPIGPGNIVGKWDQDFSIPGSFLEMDLTLNGSVISGSGNWCGEAGPCGTLTVAGTVNGDAVQLDLTYTLQLPVPGPMSTQHFAGRLTTPNALRGSVGVGTPVFTQNVSFHRACTNCPLLVRDLELRLPLQRPALLRADAPVAG
jgi:hypothetical protein